MKRGLLLLIFRVMAAGQTTEGDVVNAATGAPVAGAFVSAHTMTSSGGPLVTRTDAAGHFQLPAPVATRLPLEVVHAGFLRSDRIVPRKPGQAASTLRIELTPAAVISGKIEDEDGFPVETQVQAARYRMVNGERKLQPVAMTQTDDFGQYRLTSLAAGRYWVQVGSGSAGNWDRRYVAEYFPGTLRPEDTGQVEVEAGQEHGGVDIRLTKHEGVTVSGRVEMPAVAGAPRGVLWINLQGDGGGLPETPSVLKQPDGSFTIRHVPPGDYILRATSGDYPPKAGELLGEQKLRVGDAGEQGIVLRPHAAQAVDLAGIVLIQGGGNPPPMHIGLRGGYGGGISARSNEDGSFVLKDLVPGHYDMQVIPEMKIENGIVEPRSLAGASYPVSARLGEKEVLQAGFDLDGPPAGPLRITVSHAIEIGGKLLDASGGPVSGALLALTSEGAASQDGGAFTDADGSFQFMLRQPGDYHIYVIADQSDFDDPDYLKKHEGDFPVLKVVDGTNAQVTLRLPGK